MKPSSCSCKGYIVILIILPLIVTKSLSVVYEGQSCLNLLLLIMRLASICVFAFVAAGMGHFFLRKSDLLTSCSASNFCFSMTAGFVPMAYLTFLSLIRIRGISPFLPFGLIALYISLREISLYWGDIIPKSPDRFREIRGINLLAVVILCLLLVYALYYAMAPPFSWDAQVYHLLIPKIYWLEKGFTSIPLNAYSNMPHNQELLYLAAMLLGDDVVSKLVHFLMAFILSLSMYAFARRYFNTRTGLLAPLLFLCNPAVYAQLGIAYIDVGLALFCFWMMVCLVEYFRSGKTGYIIGMGIFCGMAMGSKYTMIYAFTSGTILLLFSPYILLRGDDFSGAKSGIDRIIRKQIRAFGIFFATSIILLIPWWIKNYLFTGNPVYPMMFSVFGGREWSAQQSAWLIDWQRSIGMGRSLIDYILLLVRIFLPGEKLYGYRGFAGNLYPWILITLPFGFMVRENRGIIRIFLLFFALFFIQWSMGSQQIRFLIPALVFPALVAGAGIDRLSRIRETPLAWIAPVLIALLPLHLFAGRILPEIRREGSFFPILFGNQTRDQFLRPRVRSYPCFEYLLGRCNEKEPVLFLFENKSYYCPQPAYADSMFEASFFLNLALESGNPQEFSRRLKRFNCRYVVVDQLIRKGMRLQGDAWLLSKRENRENFTKALDITERFIETCLIKEFEENQSTVYRFE
ncbi:glycosyltransferase family 39 protein [Candidatus Sumerlaeota bacterium]|nr:glycosyltransferase family 39 protein [Candidatus Sumerlaeota bacterium]